MVPLSEAQLTYYFYGSRLISVIFAGSAPLRSSATIFSVFVSKSLISVPFCEAVANMAPSCDKFMAAIEVV